MKPKKVLEKVEKHLKKDNKEAASETKKHNKLVKNIDKAEKKMTNKKGKC